MALEKAHVMRMVPVLEDGSSKVVASGVILEYLLLRYGAGRLRPSGLTGRQLDVESQQVVLG
jgi:glutathione S-transferase